VVQKVQDRADMTVREVISCDLLVKEIVRLVECNRYQDMKKEVVEEVIIPEFTALQTIGLRELKKRGWPKGVPRKKA